MKQEEHKEIIEKILLLFAQFEKLPRTIQNKDVAYSEHGEYISWINHQIIPLKDAYNLLSTNSYKSVFSLIRTVFEAYWVIDLSMNGSKFYLNYSPKEGHDIQKIYQKWIEDFESNKEDRLKQGILEIKPPKKLEMIDCPEGALSLSSSISLALAGAAGAGVLSSTCLTIAVISSGLPVAVSGANKSSTNCCEPIPISIVS